MIGLDLHHFVRRRAIAITLIVLAVLLLVAAPFDATMKIVTGSIAALLFVDCIRHERKPRQQPQPQPTARQVRRWRREREKANPLLRGRR